ncbi:hypothetical protein CEXT_789961 [Caerostris extrusa]|uniref:Uncharacterized protein n=1 Tax=Caerostris extrusa TaxID=172846 RepID=A0AAV4M4Z3_CAEEX|nr:hypothetical protein CEXT_789961 [Caerostris extrusa]
MQGENFLSHKLRISRIFENYLSLPQNTPFGAWNFLMWVFVQMVYYTPSVCVCVLNAFSGATKMLSDNVSRSWWREGMKNYLVLGERVWVFSGIFSRFGLGGLLSF